MKFRTLSLFLLIMWSVAALGGASSEQTETSSPPGAAALHLSLPDAIRMALSAGTQAELARSAEERARIARGEALANLLPQASASVSRYNQSINLATFGFSLPGQPPVVGPFNVTDLQLSAAMQVFNFAAIRRYQAFKQGAKASKYETQQTENDVAAAVARLYTIAERAEAQVAARQADVTLFESLVHVAEDEFKAGTGTRLDVAQANVQYDRARQALLVAQNDRQNASLALLNVIGANEASDIQFVDALPEAPAVAPSVDAAVLSARTNRPELQALEAHEREAKLVVDAARARRWPSLAFDFEGDLNGNKTDDLHWTRRIAGVASMPLFRGDINANIARAKLELHDAEIRRTQRERDVEQDVRRSILSLQNANARVEVATEGVKVAEEALTVARDRRSAGYGSSIEVDRAQDAYRQAHEDLIAARADAAAAQYDLAHSTGEIRKYIPGEPPPPAALNIRTGAAEATALQGTAP